VTEQTVTDSAPSAEERLAALYTAPEEGKADTEADSQPTEEGEAEVVEDEAEVEAADSEEAEEGQAEDEEGEADAEEDDADADESAEEPKEPEFLEIDGESVSVEEVKLGYLRQADYTRKTQAVAEQRKAAEEDRQFTASALNAVLTAVGADLSRWENVDWERAAAENPTQYAQAKAAYEHTQSLFSGIREQADGFVKRAQEAQTQALAAKAQESVAILKTTVPGWNNDLYGQLGQFAVSELGFTPDEFNQIADHRAIVSIYESMQYRKGKSVATKATVKVAPTKTLSDKKAAPSKTVTSRKATQQQRERLRQTGKVDDAVALLVNRMR
jgi:hypothetical protein